MHYFVGRTNYRGSQKCVARQLSSSMPLYGHVLWVYSSIYIEKIFVWRECIRRLINVPYNSHSILLPIIYRDLQIDSTSSWAGLVLG